MKTKTNQNPVNYHLEDGRLVIDGYNQRPSFSNFFPGIAGLWGIPMWVFYVNRGQCISSFGIESKDKSILEFQPANKSYRLTPLQGFRTFLKIKFGSKTVFHEPFQNPQLHPEQKITQRLSITSHDLTLEEENRSLGFKIVVNYFTLPEAPYTALVRRVKITNLSKKKLDIELIDGLPTIVCYGMNDWLLKNMTRTLEAWVVVHNLKKQAPYYHLKVVVNDKPVVEHIRAGNFYFAFESASGKLVDPIVEAAAVFGQSQDFLLPENFVKPGTFRFPVRQETSNRTPSAMSYVKWGLNPGAEKELTSLTGYAHEENFVNKIVAEVTKKGFLNQKAERNREIVEGIKNFAWTNSAKPEFNQYAGQTFLDNVLRGGLPVSFKTHDGTAAFNVYSRKHGDLERDYNFFFLAPTFFSQGNGNYRDVNQNRRNDPWFNPDVKEQNIINFLNLIQADGYNPLIVKGLSFSVDDEKSVEELLSCVKDESLAALKETLIKGFQPGELLRMVTEKKILLKVPAPEFLNRILGICHKNEKADHGEGYWIDHWTYNLDLIESFLSLYPEELNRLLLNHQGFHFYFDSYYILPREHRYILTDNGVRQYHSVAEAAKEIKAAQKGNKLRVGEGGGEVYHTTLIVKLLCLIANKVSTLDPSGIGIEMEADKPSWYDALNGLPGLLGSSLCETFELKRLAVFLVDAFNHLKTEECHNVRIFDELKHFIFGLTKILNEESDGLTYWDQSNSLKEHYRLQTRRGIEGRESDITIDDIKKFLFLVIEKTNQAIRKGKTSKGFSTYFTHEVVTYEQIESHLEGRHDGHQEEKGANLQYVKPLSFKLHHLPLFLEGFVHALRVESNPSKARDIYQTVRKSTLYDSELGMYKVNSDLSSESEEIGRCRIFPRGWLENESIWLHMEYKFLLELLRSGLTAEFYQELPQCLIPFMDATRYGRSVLENSSFIVSSAHEDRNLHGRGFVARLSGSTAEFLHIWLLMCVGAHPFRFHNGKLALEFKPALSRTLFTKQATECDFFDALGKKVHLKLPAHTFAFRFLGSILVVYHNPSERDTFGPHAVQITQMKIQYRDRKDAVQVSGPTINAPLSEDIRSREVVRIDVHLG